MNRSETRLVKIHWVSQSTFETYSNIRNGAIFSLPHANGSFHFFSFKIGIFFCSVCKTSVNCKLLGPLIYCVLNTRYTVWNTRDGLVTNFLSDDELRSTPLSRTHWSGNGVDELYVLGLFSITALSR